MDVIISSVMLVIATITAVAGAIFALFQWRKNIAFQSTTFVHEILLKFQREEDVSKAFYLMLNEKKKIIWKNDREKVDKLLMWMSYVCYLRETGRIKDSEFRFVEYSLHCVLESSSMKRYLWKISEESDKIDARCAFQYLIDYGIKQNKLCGSDFNFKRKMRVMGKFTGLDGALLVKDLSEAFSFYKNTLGMKEVAHHGYNILELDGKHFYSIFQVSAKEHKLFIKMMNTASYRILNASIEMETEAKVKNAFELLSEGGIVTKTIGPLPWSPCAAEVIDKYGVGWFISMPMLSPPVGCLACVPVGEKPGCDLCIRWAEEGFVCPKI